MNTKELFDLLPHSEYRDRLATNQSFELVEVLILIEKRLNDLEHKSFGNTKVVTRAQKMLLLQHLGLLSTINELPTSKNKKAKLLSILLDADADNIEGDLSQIDRKNSKLLIKKNFEFLVSTFEEAGLKDLAENADRKLDEIEKNK
jgi:hypothetical protein